MIKRILHYFIRTFEARYDYDSSYLHEILDSAGPVAFWKFVRVQGLSEHCHDLPREAWYAARLEAMAQEDCGPCTQLTIRMAEEAGISGTVLAAVIGRDDETLAPDTRLAVQFVRASVARGPEADQLRDEVLARFGPRGLVTMAYTMTSAKLYPTLKYALGHGQSCRCLEVGGELVSRHVTH